MKYLRDFEYVEPRTLEETIALLSIHEGEAKVLAGGTDLLVKMKARSLAPSCLINLKTLPYPALRSLELKANGEIAIGCLATLQSIQDSALIKERVEVLAATSEKMASPQIRNIATLGGNLCNAAPSADMAPALIALDGAVRLFSSENERLVKLEDFFLAPGQTALRKGEILVTVEIPRLLPVSRVCYQKLTFREAMDIATVSVAVKLDMIDHRCHNIRVVLGAVAPVPMRAKGAEEVMVGKEISNNLIRKVAKAAAEESKPITDVRSSANYRKHMVEVLVRRAIEAVA